MLWALSFQCRHVFAVHFASLNFLPFASFEISHSPPFFVLNGFAATKATFGRPCFAAWEHVTSGFCCASKKCNKFSSCWRKEFFKKAHWRIRCSYSVRVRVACPCIVVRVVVYKACRGLFCKYCTAGKRKKNTLVVKWPGKSILSNKSSVCWLACSVCSTECIGHHTCCRSVWSLKALRLCRVQPSSNWNNPLYFVSWT